MAARAALDHEDGVRLSVRLLGDEMKPQKKQRRDRDRNQSGRGPAKRMKRVNQHRIRRQLEDSETTLAAARSQYIY